MQREWKYCFSKSDSSGRALKALVSAREQGAFLGSTYPDGWCHSCFTEEQCQATESVLGESDFCDYQSLAFLRGNLMDNEVGIRTFSQPFVQWCPSPVYSVRFRQDIPPEEPWGLSMEGQLLFRQEMRCFLKGLAGIQIDALEVSARFDSYRVIEECTLGVDPIAGQGEILSIDMSGKMAADVFRGHDGVIVLSTALARVLKAEWDGLVHNKFQPVRCEGASRKQAAHSTRKLSFTTGTLTRESVLADLTSIEVSLGIEFKEDFKEWVAEARGQLPWGWLSPLGGTRSSMSLCISQEHSEANSAMPKHVIPLYAYGDGDYICLDVNERRYVEWVHSEGTYAPSAGKSIQDVLKLLDA